MAVGLKAVVAPLFRIVPIQWQAPDAAAFDAVLMTSANAAREAGPQVTAFLRLPCFAVGEETARACRAAGFTDIRSGPADGAALVSMAAEGGAERALHLCGREHVPLSHPGLTVARRIVYAAEQEETLPPAAAKALGEGAVALIHSPRSGTLFADLCDAAGLDRRPVRIAAISAAAAAAAGPGWKRVAIAARPRDDALLELAAKLCKTGGGDMGKNSA